MKYLFVVILIFISSNMLGQKKFCKPKKVESVAKKLIGKLSKEDYQAVMQITKDSAVNNQLFMVHKRNKRQLQPVFGYLRNEGCKYFIIDNLEKILLEYTYYKMHKIDTCMSELLQPFLDKHLERSAKLERNLKADTINGVYIPRNLEECFKQMDSYWTDSLKTEIRNMTEDDFNSGVHFGFGRWMRNNWGLWGGSRLRTYFYEMEIYHADDMSGIILDSYYRYLNGMAINLEEQVKFYQDYWKEANKGERKNKKWWKLRKNKNR